jgi:hypothetical protein
MRKTLQPWRLAVVVSSLSLACAAIAYAQWRVTPARAPEPVAEGAPAREPAEEGAEGKAEDPEVFFPGSKAPIGVGGPPQGAFKSRPKRDGSPPAPPPGEDPALLGSSKSMPLLEPPEKAK